MAILLEAGLGLRPPQKSLKCSNLRNKQSAEAGRDGSQSGTAGPHLYRGAWPLLLANEKKPLCGEKSKQLVR